MSYLLRNTVVSTVVVAFLVAVAWLIAGAMGWQFALMPTLIASILLTLVLNIMASGLNRATA